MVSPSSTKNTKDTESETSEIKQEDNKSFKKNKLSSLKKKFKRSGKNIKSFSNRLKIASKSIGTKNCNPPFVDPIKESLRIEKLAQSMKINISTGFITRIIKLNNKYIESNCNN